MSRAAVRYAKAILSLAKDQNSTDAVFDEMQRIQQTISNSKELSVFLDSPLTKSKDKVEALNKIFTNSSAIAQGLFNSLATNKRLGILNDVALSYISLYKKDKGAQVASVTTAVPLTNELEVKILEKVKELTNGKQVSLESVVDPSIIGGFVLRVGDLQYNASVASKLANLKRSFEDSSYVSKL